jgi:catechol 2,3-dioxygenase-like lactoylglutathione lyase family enzyme
MTALHHGALRVRDLDASLRFYRDGIGLALLMDHEFEGPWRELFDAPADRLRSVFLGDPEHPDAGIVELVAFTEPPSGAALPSTADPGFLLLSFFVDVDATLARLAKLGFDAPPRRVEVPGPRAPVAMATVRDPDGVLIELVGAPAAC